LVKLFRRETSGIENFFSVRAMTMIRFLLVFATFSFVLCGVMDAAHADVCNFEGNNFQDSGYAIELGSDNGENGDVTTDGDFISGHSAAHHHHLVALNFGDTETRNLDSGRFAFTAEDASSTLSGHISKPPRV
jgi:hypothetical protein